MLLSFEFGLLTGAYAQIGEPIVEVVVEQEGQPVTDPLIHRLIETTAGEPLSMRDVRETIDHLTNLRRFEDVRPMTEPVANGIRLRYVLVPLHPVDRVDFRGELGISRGDLGQILTDRFGRAPAAGRAAEAADTLRQAYRRRGFPNARVSTRIEETHDPDRATMIFDIEAGPRARIAAVQIIQVDEDEATTVIGAPDLRVGDLYDFDEVEQQLRRWEDLQQAQGYYEARASHGANLADEAAYLTVNIARGPRVVVDFAGDPLPAGERERLVPVRAEGSADEDLLEDARIDIDEHLFAQGYRDARADYTRDESAGELRITFTIARGPRYLVDAVRVTGATAFAPDEVQEILGVERGDPFVRSRLAARAAAIQNAYRTRGFTQAQVTPGDAVLPPDRPGDRDRRVEVILAIVEGPRTVVRSVTFDGATVLGEQDLFALSATAAGTVYSQAAVAASADAIELEYRNRGYEDVVIRPTVVLEEEATQADVRYAITEGPQSIVDQIIILGNDRTSPETIMNEVLLREGEPLGYSALITSRARLAALGLFRRVDIQPIQHPGEPRRDVLIQIEEADPTTLGVGGGVEASFRTRPTGPGGLAQERFELAPRGFFEIGRRNFWGKNRALNLFTRVSLRSTDIPVGPGAPPVGDGLTRSNPGFNEYRVLGTFREPRLFDSAAELLVTGIVEQAIRTTFNFSRRIARAEAGLRLSPAYSLTGWYSFEKTKLFDEIFSPDDDRQPLIDRLFPEVRLSKFAGSIIRDTRDDLLDASRGTFVIVDGEVAGRAIGSEVGFVQAHVQAFTYHQLPTARRIVVALAARVGAAHGFAREVDGRVVQDLPASERFFAGGESSVRGFSLDRLGNEETISPTGFPLGGNGVVVLNGELRVNVLGPLQAVGFLDAGNVFPRAGDLDLTDLRPAAGMGVLYRSPVGPVRLDWGFNLDRRELVPGTLERRSVFHISLGQAF